MQSPPTLTRLDDVRKQGRTRQRRTQMPLTAAGLLISLFGVGIGFGLGWIALGAFGIALGPCVLIQAVLPTQKRLIGVALGAMIVYTAGVVILIVFDALVYPCPAGNTPARCELLIAINAYCVTVLSLPIAYAFYVALALVRGWRSPRAVLETTTRICGWILLSDSVIWLTYGFAELQAPWSDAT